MKTYRMLALAGLALSPGSYLRGCTVLARPAPPPLLCRATPPWGKKSWSQHPPLSTSGFKDIGLGMEDESGSLAIGSFLPVRMPNGFLATGGISQVAGFGFLDIGDTVDVNPDGQRTSRKWELGVFSILLAELPLLHSGQQSQIRSLGQQEQIKKALLLPCSLPQPLSLPHLDHHLSRSLDLRPCGWIAVCVRGRLRWKEFFSARKGKGGGLLVSK